MNNNAKGLACFLFALQPRLQLISADLKLLSIHKPRVCYWVFVFRKRSIAELGKDIFQETQSRSYGHPTAMVTCEQPREQHVKRPIANLSAYHRTLHRDPCRVRNAVLVSRPVTHLMERKQRRKCPTYLKSLLEL